MKSKNAIYFRPRFTAFFLKVLILFLFLASCRKNKTAGVDGSPVQKDYTALVYVANEKAGTVSVIDADNSEVIKTIHIMDGNKMLMAHNVQVAPDGKTAWVTAVPEVDGEFEWLFVVNVADNSIKTKIRMGTHQHLAHVVLDDKSEFAYVTANKSHGVIKMDARTHTEVKRFYLGSTYEPHGIRFHNNKLYVACMNAKSVAIIDVVTEQLSEFLVGGVAVQTATTPDGKFVFASCYDTKEIVRMDLASEDIIHIQLQGAEGPVQIYPTPDSKHLYICDQGAIDNRPASNKVFVLDVAAASITHTILAGRAAHGVVVNNTGTRAYVTNRDDNTVSVIDVLSNSVIGTIPVGERPNGISYWYKVNGVPGGMK